MRPELAARQRARAEALAAGDPRLDLSLASLGVLADRDETDEVLAYVGEVLRRETGGGEWDRADDGTPAITWAGRTFGLRGLTPEEAAKVVAFGRDPTDATAQRLWPRQPRRRLGTAPFVAGYVAVMIALIWMAFGPRAALVGAAFGLGLHLARWWRRGRQPRAR